MNAERCVKCCRERPTYISDPTCSKGGYCEWAFFQPVSHRERVRLIGALALLIDADRPPGLAARKLAESVLKLVEGRGGLEALEISGAVTALMRRFPRKPPGSTRHD